MPLIWCAISGHGYGHAAQVIPILNELGRRHVDLAVHLRTSVRRDFFHGQLAVRWLLDSSEQDVGCVQRGPLAIDVSRTWEEYERFHLHWQERVEQEAAWMQKMQPDLVLSDISYLATAAGALANRPTVALGNLSWDQVLLRLDPEGAASRHDLLDQIQHAYRGAQVMVRLHPGIEKLPFTSVVDVGPIYGPSVQPTGIVRKRLGTSSMERLVLVACGGVPLEPLPFERLDGLAGYRFFVGGAQLSRNYERVHSTSDLGLPFCQVLAESDVVITKPGYATIVDAVRYRIPVVYVRRYNFVDEENIVEYLHRYGTGVELAEAAFHACDWLEALERVQALLPPSRLPPESGVAAAADVIESFLPSDA